MEAADNVVHAYDLNMEVPDSPTSPVYDESGNTQPTVLERRPNILIEGSNIPIIRGKRRGSDSFEWMAEPLAKRRQTESQDPSPQRDISPHTSTLLSAVGDKHFHTTSSASAGRNKMELKHDSPRTQDIELKTEHSDVDSTAGLRHIKIREILHLLIHECLRTGGRPESAIAEDTACGEIIEVRTRASIGTVYTKVVEWSVDPSVPETTCGEYNSPAAYSPETMLTVERS